MNLIEGNLMVELEDIGEGLSGDYIEDDPKDVPLLRFTVYEMRTDDEGHSQWEQIDDASYCTLLDVNISDEIKERALKHIMGEVLLAIGTGASLKRTCEGLSWIKPSDFAGDPKPKADA